MPDPRSPKASDSLPGPRGLPIVGHLHRIRLNRLHLILEDWAEQYGKIFQFRIGPHRIVVISDRSEIQNILFQRPGTYRRTSALESVAKEMNLNGVFSSEGDGWRQQRKLVVSAFDRQNLRSFFPKLAVIVARLQKRWERAADASEEVDICRDLMRFTVDVTMQFAFGVDANTLETSGPVIQRHLDQVFPVVHTRMYAVFPWWRHIKLPSDRAFMKSLAVIEDEIRNLINLTRERMKAEPGRFDDPENFLEAIITASEVEDSGISDTEIFANVGNLLLAGEDTTANSLAWIIYFLLKYPHHFKRAQQEVDAVLAPEPILVRMEQTTNLPFIDACCSETMRLKPVAPLHVVQTMSDVNILGCAIPTGTQVMLLTRKIAMQDENFGHGKLFDPDRWLTSTQDTGFSHDRRAFVPFGNGPRICPGRVLALLEIRSVLAMLCRNFVIEPVRSLDDVVERLAFTMMPVNLPVMIRRRPQAME